MEMKNDRFVIKQILFMFQLPYKLQSLESLYVFFTFFNAESDVKLREVRNEKGLLKPFAS